MCPSTRWVPHRLPADRTYSKVPSRSAGPPAPRSGSGAVGVAAFRAGRGRSRRSLRSTPAARTTLLTLISSPWLTVLLRALRTRWRRRAESVRGLATVAVAGALVSLVVMRCARPEVGRVWRMRDMRVRRTPGPEPRRLG